MPKEISEMVAAPGLYQQSHAGRPLSDRKYSPTEPTARTIVRNLTKKGEDVTLGLVVDWLKGAGSPTEPCRISSALNTFASFSKSASIKLIRAKKPATSAQFSSRLAYLLTSLPNWSEVMSLCLADHRTSFESLACR
jgi:hypothetical protein